MTYYILHLDGDLVGVTNSQWVALPGVSVIEMEGTIPDLNKITWNKDELCFNEVITKISKLDFMSRFTSTERIAVQNSNDPILKDALNLLQMAEFIDLTDQRTMTLVGYMAMTGIIDNSRVTEVLS